jgi:L-aminoadipate-semialdehyde dehydrogenase
VSFYKVELVEYIHWRSALLDLTLKTSDHALFPLLHFVVDDLPTSTKNPELDDSNMREINKNSYITCPKMNELVPLYLGYLCHVKFLPQPIQQLPKCEEWTEEWSEVVTRSGQ